MEKKYSRVLITVMLLLAIAVAGITHSYYIDKQEKINVIDAGSSNIEITENFPKPPDVLRGGETYTKEVRVKNLEAESWIRMRVEVNNSEIESFMTINFLNSNWKQHSDGYYYYTRPVKKGETTEPIFETVTVHRNIPSEYLKIICYAESVQAEGHKSGTEPYLEAFRSIQ